MFLNLEAIKYNTFKGLFNHLPDKARTLLKPGMGNEGMGNGE